MANKISISLNLSKIDKNKIIERVYKNKAGEEVKEKLYKFDLIESTHQTVVATGDTWILKKTHFGVEQQSKEEKAQKVKPSYVAEGLIFESKEESNKKELD